MTTAFITGITGMVGSHLTDYLLANTDWKIYGLARWNDSLDNIEHLAEKINKKELGKKINLMSIYNQLSIQMLNMLIQSKKLSDYTMIRSKLYKYNTLNLDKIMLVKKILQNIASIDNMDNELKHEIMSLGNDFSKSYTKSDKSIIVLETFIIHLWKKLNNF